MFNKKVLSKIEKNKKVYVFIDASNVWATQKTKGCFLDFKKLKEYIEILYTPVKLKLFYYCAFPKEGTRGYDNKGKNLFYRRLTKIGYKIVKKPLKRIRTFINGKERIFEKGNMDVEMAVDSMRYLENYDIAIFFSGDSDFAYLLSSLKRKKKKVYVYSSKKNISSELLSVSHKYYDLLKIKEDI